MGVILAVALLISDQQGNGLKNVRATLSILVYPLQLLVSLPVDMGESMSDTFVSYQSLKDENRTLKEKQLIND